MAADKSVQNFLILFCVGCIVSYGSCAPIEEKIVLDNGTVLTMVIHDVKEAPPPDFESALDASNTDEAANPNIVIHEAQYPPAPRVMSKRSAGDDPIFNIRTEEPILALPPRSDSKKKLREVGHPGAVEAAVQSTTGVPKPDERGENDAIETKKVTEPSKSDVVLPEKADSQPDKDAEDDKADEEGGDEEQRTATPIALPFKPTDKVDIVKSNDDSKDGSDEQQDTKLPGEELGSTPSGEISRNIKSTTEKIGEVADNKVPGDDEQKNEAIATQPPVKTSSDDGKDDDPTSDKGDDDGNDDDDDGDGEEKDNKGSSNANGDGKIGGDEGEDAEDDYDDGEDDDANSNPKADKNATSDGNEDDDAEDDDDDDRDDDGKLLVDDDDKGKTLLKPLSGENSESEGSNSLKKTISDEPQSSGHFMSYFLIAVVFVACFYLIFHNRQKIKAYVLEGKTGRGRRRKAGNSEYRQLSTADEVLPDTDKGIESKTTYTY